MSDITTIENPKALVSHLEQEYPYEQDALETIASNVRTALKKAHQRFGDQHAVFTTQNEDGSIECSLGRVDPVTNTSSQMYGVYVRTDEGLSADIRDAGQVTDDPMAQMQHGEYTFPTLYDTIRLPVGVEGESNTAFTVYYPNNMWSAEAAEDDYTLPTGLRGRVFTAEFYRLTEHHLYVNEGDDVRFAVDKQRAGAMQSCSKGQTPSYHNAFTEDGVDYVYYPYTITNIDGDELTLEPKNIDHNAVPDDANVVEHIGGQNVLGFIIGGVLLPPKRGDQTTETAGEIEVKRNIAQQN